MGEHLLFDSTVISKSEHSHIQPVLYSRLQSICVLVKVEFLP